MLNHGHQLSIQFKYTCRSFPIEIVGSVPVCIVWNYLDIKTIYVKYWSINRVLRLNFCDN
jgi:hypothetical protein